MRNSQQVGALAKWAAQQKIRLGRLREDCVGEERECRATMGNYASSARETSYDMKTKTLSMSPIHSRILRVAAISIMTALLAGCGTSNALPASPGSPSHHVTAVDIALAHRLHNTYWYPPPVTKHYATTKVAYEVPSTLGLQAWSDNPTHSVLGVVNRLRKATAVQQVQEYTDPSFWPDIAHQWTFPRPHSPGYRQDRKALTVHNIGSMPASQSPYAGLIKRWYGPEILSHSWVLALGHINQSFSTWIKKHPALTPWFYFVDVRGHWLLYNIQN